MNAIKHTFHTRFEQYLLEALRIVYPDPHEICPKVRLADLIKVDDRWTQREQRFLLMAHVDAAVILNNYPVAAFEYDGYTHRLYPAQQQRDALKDDLCRRAGLRLVRVPDEVFVWLERRTQQEGKTPTQILTSLLTGVRAYLEVGSDLRLVLYWVEAHPQFIPGDLDLAGLATLVKEHGSDTVCALLQKRAQRDGLRDELDVVQHLLGEAREITELRLMMRHNPRYRPLVTLVEMAAGCSLALGDMAWIRENWSGDRAGQNWARTWIQVASQLLAARLVVAAYVDENDEDLYTLASRHFKNRPLFLLTTLQESLERLADDHRLTAREAMDKLELNDRPANQ